MHWCDVLLLLLCVLQVPVMCEDADVPYVYIPSKQDLGAAGQTKRCGTLATASAPCVYTIYIIPRPI